jgi:hypothetical protein
MSNAKDVLDWMPSPKMVFIYAWCSAKKISYRELYYFGKKDKCYICGREKDYLFDFVQLVPFLDISSERLVYICDDHGRVTDYNCLTGEPVNLPLPKSYWHRKIRNFFQKIILWLAIIPRFIWFLFYDAFMWYLMIWFYWIYKKAISVK